MSTILMYHYIDGAPAQAGGHRGLYVPPAEFRHHLRALARAGRRSLSPAEYGAGLGRGALDGTVWITFDDGRLDNYTQAFPALLEEGFRATFFVIADAVLGGKEGWLSAGMLREMAGAGMSIGSHTLSHPRLARLPADRMRQEVADSKKRLEDALGVAVDSFCYPYGNWNGEVLRAVREAGYRLAVSTIRGNRNREEERFRLKRVMVQPGRSGLRFRYLFTPVYHWVHERKNRRRWGGVPS